MSDFDLKCINTIRMLAADGVQKADSGHPGLPMGAAPMAYVLWTRYLKHNPRDPQWPDRDRFILSAGHGSMLLYALLHLTGYDLPLEELKQFRQWGSKTPGHPEYGLTPGVETTTGPLGQGFSNGVGMAIAEAHLAARLNTASDQVVDHYTYGIVSDGDLMEGVSSEAASLAGHLKLGKLIYLYDDNSISIEGSTNLAFTEDVGQRFEAYGWQVQRVEDGNDLDAIDAALRAARQDTGRPSLIMVKTVIGYGSPNKAGTAGVHGSPLGPDEVAKTKEALGWPAEPTFYIPDDVLAHFRQAVEQGAARQQEWQTAWDAWANANADKAALWKQLYDADGLSAGWDKEWPSFSTDAKPIATRSASGKVMNAIADQIPGLIGGSADLAPSTKTNLDAYPAFTATEHAGRNFHFGVREHAMGGIVNGMAYHGGVIPFGATFLVFSDYMRGSIRVGAISELGTVWVFTHDSIGVGEDGPTHQPVEQVMSLRLMPHLEIFRPADANETAAAWHAALHNRHQPSALVLTRQNLPVLDPGAATVENVARGGYVLSDAPNGQPQALILGSGSEVHLALEAQQKLAEQGVAARVVSMPCWKRFEAQPQDYRDSVLPPTITARVSVEAGVTTGWERWIGRDGIAIGLDRFGASAPQELIYEHLGITADAVADAVKKLVG